MNSSQDIVDAILKRQNIASLSKSKIFDAV